MNGRTVQFGLGLLLALIGAFLMFDSTVLGERTLPAAIVTGIVGLILIATSRRIQAREV